MAFEDAVARAAALAAGAIGGPPVSSRGDGIPGGAGNCGGDQVVDANARAEPPSNSGASTAAVNWHISDRRKPTKQPVERRLE
jgi:hypothetical protein